MATPLYTQENLPWLPPDSIVETFLADANGSLPPIIECTAAFALVFKKGKLLQTDLKEGERLTRQLDIPGGHIDPGESPEKTATRETFEETGVHVTVLSLAGYARITHHGEKPANYKYPYPVNYMLYYLCEAGEETEFRETNDAHGRVWITPEEYDSSDWCKRNKVFIEAVRSSLQSDLP